MIVLIVATYSYMQPAELNALSQDALLSRRASLKRREEPGAFERRCDPALSSQLQDAKKLSREEYALLHPAGALGAKARGD